MRNTVLAKRYAKALFVVGQEEGALESYNKALAELAGLFLAIPEVDDGVNNPLYPLDVRVKVMEQLLDKLGVSGVAANFAKLLVLKKRSTIIPEIAESFQKMVDDEQNICKGTVVTATGLDSTLEAEVRATLEKLTGKKVVLKSEIDPTIIGGIIAKVGDLVLDGSIKTQLAGLKEAIKGE